MKRLLIAIFCFLTFSVYSQDDPGLSLSWTSFVDSNDFRVIYDSTLTIDSIVVIDSVTSEETTIIDTSYVLVPIDTTFIIKYMAYDTQSVSSQGILIYQRIRTQEEQTAVLKREILKYADVVAINQRNAMMARAKLLSAKKYYEDFTGVANAFVDIYNTYWERMPVVTLRSTNTDVNSPYYFPPTTGQPNAAGVLRDENNTIIARIFPLGNKYFQIFIANNGSLNGAVGVVAYSEDSQRFITYDNDENVGRVVLFLSEKMR